MSENMIASPERDIQTVTTEIRTLHRQAQGIILGYAVEIGRRLVEAKTLLPHGEWGEWLKNEVEFSQSSANNFMRIFEEYGDEQISIFGVAPNSQTLGNLSYSKALKLLAIPADEREDFAAEHDVENLSTRELERLIKERDEAKKEAETFEDKLAAAEEAREAADEELQKLKNELKTIKNRPVEVAVQEPDEGTLKKIREEAETAAAKKQEALEKKLAQAEKKLEAAQKEQERLKKEREEAEKKLEQAASGSDAEKEALAAKNAELQKQLAVADPFTAQFKVLFEEAQGILNKLMGLLMKADEGKRDGLRKAMSTLLITYAEKVKGE